MGSTRSRRRYAAIGTVVALAALAATVVTITTAASALDGSPRPCGPGSVSCALPYPSMSWLTPDRSTATGFHTVVPAGSFPAALLDQLGPGARLDDVVASADGFSPLAPVIFELPAPVDPASVPSDGGDVVKVFDLATGARVPIRAEISKYAVTDFASPTILMAWPVTHFEFGARYFAAVTDTLRSKTGKPLVASTKQVDVWTRLQAATVDPTGDFDRYVETTSWVVRSRADVVDDVDRMAAQVRADDHPIRSVQVSPSLLGGVAMVTGQVRATDFRDAHGVIAGDGTATAHATWIDFTMTMPDHGATAGGAPVVIYGHGLSAFKETELVVASDNARHGLATIAIDIPDHGSRISDGGFLLDIANPKDLGRLTSMPLQGVLDEVSLLRAIKTHFSTLDALPLRWLAGTWGDGVAELDTSHVYYEGTSLGGILGLTFLGLAPEVDGAFLQVPGAGIVDIMFHSILWDAFKGVVPTGAKVGDAHALLGNAHMLLDRADDTFYLDRIRARSTPVYIVYAENDGVVPNAATNRLIALTGFPLVGAQVAPTPPGIVQQKVATMPASGTGVQQIDTTFLDGNFFKPLLTHTSFTEPAPTAALNAWLTQRVEAIAGR